MSNDHEPIVGVAVLDLETGERELWEVESTHGLFTGGMAWAGDVLWWSAGPVSRDETGAQRAQLRTRTWDTRTDARDESTGAARRRLGLDLVGDAPGGFVHLERSSRLNRVAGAADPSILRLAMPTGVPGESGPPTPR